ncbi:site-specific integrase [Sphingobium sp. 3R8]|uniref:site-specific integrase n=1 Tax=Sphingobium sp. 3R8 TaxID=2874921 RepID=UPI001CCDAABE|nr:site-specific integrase [Sphingobium sp. 3R8]MBZ9649418.1 site-specific integrase [Sphingobium sp. 3R8]
MRLMTHVRRSSDGGFEVRIVVPVGLRSTIGKTNLTRRLGRLSKSDANRLAAPVIQQFHDLIERAKVGPLDDPSPVPVAVATLPQPSRPYPRQASSPKLMAIFDGYLRERQPSPATIKRWRPVITHLVDHLGHDEPRSISADDIIGWKEALARQGASGRTIREVYLAAAKVVFAWGVENRKLDANPAAGVSVRVPKRHRPRGPSFTSAEARTILSASLSRDQGKISREHALARRWIPWMCAYSGARVGEIAQMRGRDIIEVEGIWAMRITPEAGSTKSGQARIVPLHPHLVEQGLLRVAEQAGDGPIFYDPARGRGGSAGNAHYRKVGERLAAWVRDLGINDPHVQPNHGWRHLYKTLARRAGMEPEVRDAIQGHAPRSIGETYGEWPIDVLARAVNRCQGSMSVDR